jgi:hypothetical protein
MTAAERNRRKRRLEAEGFKALPTGWVPAAYADRVAAQVETYRDEVAKIEAIELPRGRPPKRYT